MKARDTLLPMTVSLLFVLLLGEAVLRISDYEPFAGEWLSERHQVIRPSELPGLEYELTPGASARAFDTDVVINADGYRGPRGRPGKYPGFRALVLGDSITFGFGVPLADTFPERLQMLLREEKSRVEVLNFGVGGYDSLQEVTLLEHRGLAYEPDLVVVAYCLNDTGITSTNLDYIENLRRLQEHGWFRLRSAQWLAARFGRLQLRRVTAELNEPETFRRRYAGRIQPIGEEESELRALMASVSGGYPASWYRSPDRIGRLRYAFERLGRLADHHDFEVLVAIVPWLVRTKNGYPLEPVHRIVRSEARRVGFDVVDLTSDFLAAGIYRLRHDRDDPTHPNARGHAVIAHSLAEVIEERYLSN